MKILPISDMHADLNSDRIGYLLENWTNIKPDLILLAGDAGELNPETKEFLTKLCSIAPVLAVSGNHEYWRSSPDEVTNCLKFFEGSNPRYKWLDNDIFEFNGQRFLGTTLWYPRPKEFAITKEFPDFKRIKHFVPWVYKQHEKSVNFLKQNLKEGDIVITHHVPTLQFTQEEYIGDPWNV